MSQEFLSHDQVEDLVKKDLQRRYQNLKYLEFTHVELLERFKEWWLFGIIEVPLGFRSFMYILDAKTGEIKSFEVRI